MSASQENAATAAGRPRLTVLVISWNAWHHLQPCIASILASDYGDLGILVIDNASADGSAEKLAARYPGVALIRNGENVGHTRAVNQGFRAVDSELILLLDADTELAPDAIRHMVELLDGHQDAELVAPRTYNTDGSVQESARNFPSAINGLFGRQAVLTRWFPNNRFSRRYLQRESLAATEPFRVFSVASSSMLLKRSLVERVGEWDEGYPGYFVDTDWCYRLGQAGVGIYCVPAARVVHHEQNSRKRKRSPSRIWMFHRGALRFYRKNRTLGWADPRTLLAALALGTRAALLVAANAFKESPPAADRRPAPEGPEGPEALAREEK